MKAGTIILAMAVYSAVGFHTAPAMEKPATAGNQGIQLRVTVTDAEEKLPMELVRVVLRKDGRLTAQDATNPAGQIRFRDIQPGRYSVTAWFLGYKTYVDSLTIDRDHASLAIALHAEATQEDEVEVVADRELAQSHIDPMTGNQIFESETYHVPPTARMTNLIQENVMGAVRAPTGEVHIRGQHGEFTYYIDGIPVPLGVFGGLNEVVDPKVISRATFITGGFPAEYGGQMSAVVDLNNRVPTGTFQLDAATYAGSYLVFNGAAPFSKGDGTSTGEAPGRSVGPFRSVNSNGQNLSISDHVGNLGFFLSGSRQETDRRIDPPVPSLFHDHGFDYFLYGKFDYILSDIDYLTANVNYGRTYTEVPYDSILGINNDIQKTTNGFQTISYFRTLDADIDNESHLFAGVYGRQGGLQFTPGDNDPRSFRFAGDTLHNYLLTEDRTFTTVGIRSTFDKRLSHDFMYKAGFLYSSTRGTEQFTSRDSANVSGPSIVSGFAGSDFGAFAEIDWHPLESTSFEIGIRYDRHSAPDIPVQTQASPRVRWNFFIDDNNSAYIYYGRLFMPTNIEGLRSIALNVSNSLVPTLPERDDFYEAVYTHIFSFGLRSKLAAFYKKATPGIDDQTVGGTAIKTPVNIAEIRTEGLELGLTYADPETPFSAYINSSIIHAYGSGAITGGFLDFSDAGPATDLDHDQRLSLVTGMNYQPHAWFFNLVGIYGSGLTNGNPGNAAYSTGLFDFNAAAHTNPSWIFNASIGHTYQLAGGASLEPSLFVNNLLDHSHRIKGAFFSGASWEERRNVVLKVSVHM